MRVAILSDIHANSLALEAVLDHSQIQDVDSYWFLGDLVGYGPSPVEVMQWLSGKMRDFPQPDSWVLGNHDAMMADLVIQGKTGMTDEFLMDPVTLMNYPLEKENSLPHDKVNGKLIEFSIKGRKFSQDDGRPDIIIYRGKSRGKFMQPDDWNQLSGVTPLRALELNRLDLSEDEVCDHYWHQAFTSERKEPRKEHHDGIDYLLAHGSVLNPLIDYIYAWQRDLLLPPVFNNLRDSALESGFPQVHCYGQTHVPMFVKAELNRDDGVFQILDDVRICSGHTYSLKLQNKKTCLSLINPGSVGQPRDLDPRAAYAVLDTVEQTVSFHRVSYAHRLVANQLSVKKYPSGLRQRILNPQVKSHTPLAWKEHYQKARKGCV
jgi:predicted phosphodiesterase